MIAPPNPGTGTVLYNHSCSNLTRTELFMCLPSVVIVLRMVLQVYMRKGRILLSLQAVNQAVKLVSASHPDVHRLIVRLCRAVQQQQQQHQMQQSQEPTADQVGMQVTIYIQHPFRDPTGGPQDTIHNSKKQSLEFVKRSCMQALVLQELIADERPST